METKKQKKQYEKFTTVITPLRDHINHINLQEEYTTEELITIQNAINTPYTKTKKVARANDCLR